MNQENGNQRPDNTNSLVAVALIVVVLIPAPWILGGCKMFTKQPNIRSGSVLVTAPLDAGKPASLAESTDTASLPLPAGSRLTLTKVEATKAIPATDTSPAIPYAPAKEITEVQLSGDTEYRRTAKAIDAQTGTVDTSIAKHRIDVASRQWLLWAAIACGVGGLVIRSTMPAWPSLSNGLLMGAVAAGLAWKMAEVPAWLWLCILGFAGVLVLGYKRREKDEKEEKLSKP